MKAYKDYVVTPVGSRYNNIKKIGKKELILNTEVSNHQYINRLAKVVSTPMLFDSPIEVGDDIIVHHNVFRRWYNIRGEEKNSRSYLDDNKYIVSGDQVFLYKKDKWFTTPGYTFVKSMIDDDTYSVEKEKNLIGVVKYSDNTFTKGDVIGFSPNQRMEYVIDGQKLWRIMNKFITIKYGHKGNQKEYNPSWAQSS
tara:strand:- start:1123 stop:1710 length:588 start_codon:yes stop_codon:yes gene_type:complete